MAFSHRIATLAAVVAIPLGIAATSYALADSPTRPEVPGRVELDNGSPSGSPDPGTTGRPTTGAEPTGDATATPDGGSPTAPPSDVVVPQPPATDSNGDDDSDDTDDDTDDDG